MTHRDGFPRLSASSAWRSDAGHRKPCAPSQSHGPSESLGKPPFRSRGRTAGGRRKASTMTRSTRGFPPTRPLARRIACAISMGHYQGPLVLWARDGRGPLWARRVMDGGRHVRRRSPGLGSSLSCGTASVVPRFRPVGKIHCTSRRGAQSVVVYHIPETIDQPCCDQN